jgi:hypothetical protein
MHRKIVARYGGWSLGVFDEPQPDEHMFDRNGHRQGDRIPWHLPEPGTAGGAVNPATAQEELLGEQQQQQEQEDAVPWYLEGFKLMEIMNRFDADGDGVLNEAEQKIFVASLGEEYRESMEEQLRAADVDGDGMVDVGELQKMLAVETERDTESDTDTESEDSDEDDLG